MMYLKPEEALPYGELIPVRLPKQLQSVHDFILLLPWSNLKNKKKWKHNKKLIKKFCKHINKYVPYSIRFLYEDYMDVLYRKGLKEIMEKEDKQLLELLKKVA